MSLVSEGVENTIHKVKTIKTLLVSYFPALPA